VTATTASFSSGATSFAAPDLAGPTTVVAARSRSRSSGANIIPHIFSASANATTGLLLIGCIPKLH
jgi:hypothetical protein